MGRLPVVVLGTLVLPVLLGCDGAGSPQVTAYLAVIDSVSEKVAESVALNFPDGANVCFASTFWLKEAEETTALPGPLQDELAERGWALYDPGTPPGPNTVLVFVSEPFSVDEGRAILAGYQVWQVFDNEVSAWGRDWEYPMECRRHACSVTKARGGSDFDLASTPLEEYMARNTGVCSGSVPG